jgi:transposase
MSKKLPPDTQNSIQTLLEDSIGPAVIGKRAGVHRNTVIRYANKWMHNRIRKRGERPSTVTESIRQYIKRLALTGRLKAAKDVQMKLEGLRHPMSYQSAINVLHSVEIYAEIKKKKPLLTEKHKKARLAWAKKHQYWTVHDWRRVIFSDETKINIWDSDGCKYYWKRKCDRLQSHHIDVTMKHGGGGLVLWDCITSKGLGYACQIYRSTINSEAY